MPQRVRVWLMGLVATAVAGSMALGQSRGGGPPGGGVGRPPIAEPGNRPGDLSDFPGHGRPAWAGENAHTQPPGWERALEERRLAEPEQRRAEMLAKADPRRYELDRNGALAVRGEVLALVADTREVDRASRAGFAIERRENLPVVGADIVVVHRDDLSAIEAARQLRRLMPTAVLSLNHVMFESSGRGKEKAHLPLSQRQTDSSARIGPDRIGMVDTGIVPGFVSANRAHIVQRAFAGADAVGALHGTAVAQLLMRGAAARQVTIYAADIFGQTAHGGTSELLVRALGWMADQRVPVINVSMVGPANPVVGLVTERLIGQGYTIVAPVGNDGATAQPLFPASYPGVVAVTAIEDRGDLLPEASRVSRVDFAAPGIAKVYDATGHLTQVRGTSFAAPVVSRLLADRVGEPNRRAARQAIADLARAARKPASDRRYFGNGIVAVADTAR